MVFHILEKTSLHPYNLNLRVNFSQQLLMMELTVCIADPIAQRGLLGAAPPGVRPIQIPIPQILPSPKKVSNDWDSRSKPQPTSTPSVTSVPNTKVDADDPTWYFTSLKKLPYIPIT
jgi:hypothetical protein